VQGVLELLLHDELESLDAVAFQVKREKMKGKKLTDGKGHRLSPLVPVDWKGETKWVAIRAYPVM